MAKLPEDFMRQAIALSAHKMEEGFGGPFAAIIVKGDEIVAQGFVVRSGGWFVAFGECAQQSAMKLLESPTRPQLGRDIGIAPFVFRGFPVPHRFRAPRPQEISCHA